MVGQLLMSHMSGPVAHASIAERLVEVLLSGEAIKSHDAHAAAEVYSDFVDAFIGHGWSERRLGRAGRSVILRAAALA